VTEPAILGLGTAVPNNRYDQMKIAHSLAPAFNSHRAPAVFRATEVETRHCVLQDLDWLVANPNNGARLQAYMTHAVPLGVEAIEQALQTAQINPAEVDNLIIVSCTGVDTPGLDVRIADAMGMSPYLRRATLVGMGCQALLPALYQAQNIILVEPQSKVVILTLELCTLHFQHGKTLKNILGSALFADGASATVVGNDAGSGPRLLDSLTYCDYQTQEELSFRPGDTGYQISLTGRIPELLAAQVPPLVDRFLSQHALTREEIIHWAVHPGGLRILDCVEAALGLPQNQFDHARAIFRRYGNMSSATLLFVLNRIIKHAKPATGDYGLLIGFGPGLTIEIGLIQWQ